MSMQEKAQRVDAVVEELVTALADFYDVVEAERKRSDDKRISGDEAGKYKVAAAQAVDWAQNRAKAQHDGVRGATEFPTIASRIPSDR